MVGVINRRIAEDYLLNKFTVDEVMEYIRQRSNLSIEIRKEGTTKRVLVTNRFWVNPTHQVGPRYHADEWSDIELMKDCANKIAAKLGLRKIITITEH